MPLDRGSQSDVQGGVTPLPPRPATFVDGGKIGISSAPTSSRDEVETQLVRGFDTVVRNLRALNQEVDRSVRDIQAARQREAMFGAGGGAAAGAATAWGMMRDTGIPHGSPASVPMRMGYSPTGDITTSAPASAAFVTGSTTARPESSASADRLVNKLERERDFFATTAIVEARKGTRQQGQLDAVSATIPATAQPAQPTTTAQAPAPTKARPEHSPRDDVDASAPRARERTRPPEQGAEVPERGRGERTEGPAPYRGSPHHQTRYQRGRDYVHGGMYEDVGNWLQRRGTNLQGAGPNLVQDPMGEYVHADGPMKGQKANASEVMQHRNTEGMRQLMTKAGQSISNASSASEAFEGVLGAAESMQGAGGAAGMLGSAASMAGPMLGLGGIAVGGAALYRGGVQAITQQRQANAQWAQIYGGGTGIFGPNTGRDIAAKAFTFNQYNPFSNAFGIGQGTLSKLYGGSAQLGFRGPEFGSAVDFGISNFSKYGMSPDSSLQLLQTSIEGGNRSLTGLKETLDGVAKSAQATGQAVGTVQEKFSQSYKQIAGVIGGANAPVIAGGVTNAATKLGVSYQGVDFSSLFSSTRNLQVLGAMRGQTTGQAIASADTNPSSLGNTAGQLVAQRAGAGFRGDWQKVVADYMAKKGLKQGDTMTDGQIREIVNQLEQGGNVPYPEVIVSQLQNLGIKGVTTDNAVGIALQAQLNPNFLGQNIQQTQGDRSARITSKGTTPLAQINQSKMGHGRTSGHHVSMSSVEDQYLRTLGTDPRSRASIKGLNLTGDVDTRQRIAYLEAWRKTGVQSPLVDKLVNSPQSHTDRFEVVDEHGKKRVVSLADGLSKYYDQFVSGEAIEVAGPNKGQTIASATGMPDASGSRETRAAASQANRLENKSGRTDEMLSHWNAAHKGDSNAQVKGGIKIEATDELRRYFKLPHAIDLYDQSRYSGNPVDPTNNPAQRKNG